MPVCCMQVRSFARCWDAAPPEVSVGLKLFEMLGYSAPRDVYFQYFAEYGGGSRRVHLVDSNLLLRLYVECMKQERRCRRDHQLEDSVEEVD